MKQDLILRAPLLNAAGSLGFAPDERVPLEWNALGAFITNPISFRPRRVTAAPEVFSFPGGFLLHTGLPNPGFRAALEQYAARWKRASLPVIVHLMADRPQEAARMASVLEDIDNLLALELGFAPRLADDIPVLAVELCRGELPLIVNLPEEQIFSAGRRCLEAGARALSLAAPRGALPLEAGETQTGRLFGPSLFARSLLVVREAAQAGIPLIGAGGVYSKENASAMLLAGALAVQVDAVLWRGGFRL